MSGTAEGPNVGAAQTTKKTGPRWIRLLTESAGQISVVCRPRRSSVGLVDPQSRLVRFDREIKAADVLDSIFRAVPTSSEFNRVTTIARGFSFKEALANRRAGP